MRHGSGEAYIYERNSIGSWVRSFTFTAQQGSFNQGGRSVALSGDLAAAAQPFSQGTADGVYVFVRDASGWSSDGFLPQGPVEDIALSGDTLAVARLSTVDVYRRSGPGAWSVEAGLAGVEDLVDGDRLVARRLDGQGFDSYARQGTVWTLEGSATAPASFESFDLVGTRVLLGAPSALPFGTAFLYELGPGGWNLTETLTPNGFVPGTVSDFGASVGLADDLALVGAPESSPSGGTDKRGLAYVFREPGEPTFYCTGKTSSLSCVPFLTTSGTPSVTPPVQFRITARNAIPNEAGFLMYSLKKANLNFHGGKFCVKAPWQRVQPAKTAIEIVLLCTSKPTYFAILLMDRASCAALRRGFIWFAAT